MTPAQEVGTRLAIKDYVDMVVLLGTSYHPDTSATEYGNWALSVRNTRATLMQCAPNVDEYYLTLKVFRWKGWV